jgi:hypothetical protein
LALALWTAPAALAGPPSHQRTPTLDVEGLNRACGVAVDSQGDLYASSAGESKIEIFGPVDHETPLGEIANSNQPCGIAVDPTGNLYVSEKATGEVVRYHPTEYPFTGTPSYEAPVAIDTSGEAKGISVDRYDGGLYVAEGERVAVYANELQTVSLGGQITGGTFKLKFEGQETPPLPYNATAAEMQMALASLSTIGVGNVEVVKPSPRVFSVFFVGKFAFTDVPAMGSSNSLTGSENPRVNVGETSKGLSGHIAEGSINEATGVAAYTSPTGDHHLFVADARGLAADELVLLSGPSVAGLKLRREITGAATPDGSFEFGAAGAQLAADPGNKEADGSKCASIVEQACTAGHLFLYDAVHAALDEFDASGEYLDRISGPELADAEPSGIAVDRSGDAADGTIFLGVGVGAGAKVLAYGPLAAPSRPGLDEPLSHLLESARAVATDDHGDVYAAAGGFVHVYGPLGNELTSFEDPHPSLDDLAVDSEGNVYVLELAPPVSQTVHYYTPSQYPPRGGTTYARHEPAVAEFADFPSGSDSLRAIAVDPGPGAGRDRLFLVTNQIARVYKPAREGSGVLNPEFGAGLLAGPMTSIAVDGASARGGGQTTVYVTAGGSSTIQRVNGAGDEVVGRINGAGCPRGAMGVGTRGLAVDQADGHVLEFQSVDEAAREYDGAGACVAEFGHFTNLVGRGRGIAVDSACALHVNEETGEEEPLDETTTPTCAEYDPADGNTYVAFDDTRPEHPPYDITAFGPLSYGGPPEAETGTPSEMGGGQATLNGTLNPRGFEVEACGFKYLSEDEYEANVEAEEPAFLGAASAPCVESAAEIGRKEKPAPVHATVGGLDPEGHYCVRLVAANKYGTSEGEALCFGPPRVEAEPARPIHYTEITVRAKVDPAGLPTHYRCEYGDAAGAYDHATSPQPLAPGAGESDVQCVLTGLAGGTAYHVRVVAENVAGIAAGVDQEVVTLARRAAEPCPNAEYRTGLSAKLPDCRAYELVTPAATNGLSPRAPDAGSSDRGFDQWLTPPRGGGAGQSLSYITPGTLPGFEGNGVTDGYLAARGAGEHPIAGWQSSFFGPTYAQADPELNHSLLMQGISSDQSYSIWLVEPTQSFAELAAGIYLRTPAGFEALGRGDLGEDLGAAGRYLSADAAHVIFSSSAHLEPAAPPAGTEALYDRAAGATHAEVLSLDAKGSAFGGDATYLGANEAGTSVVFAVGGALYERRGGATVEVAAAPATFAAVSEDGGRVFYAAGTDGKAPAALYVCEVEAGPCAGSGAQPPVQIAVAGIFADVSADGSVAYFSSEDALTGAEENENGETAGALARNLYAWDGGDTRFVARLAAADFAGAAFGGISGMNLGAWTRAIGPPPAQSGRAYAPIRSTPSGGVLAFQSHARLTAYDNEGAGEIYRYDPTAPTGERLTCPSCDPSGAPASADALLQDTEATATTAHIMIPNLTADGMGLVFSSRDRLLPEDANSVADVYEWRAQGSRWGSAAGAPSCARTGGCLALISSGQGERDSYLYSMSSDGHDVFFRTLERLVGADAADSVSIYDAREGGGVPEAVAAAPCAGDACQGQGAEAPSLPAPATTGAGNGNLEEVPKRRRCPKGRRPVGRNGKRRCVKQPRHHHRNKHPKTPRNAGRSR